MRVVFMGTPELAAEALAGLYQAGYELPLVVTQPDRPKGRGQKLAFSPVKEFALSKGLAVFQPDSLKTPDALERILEARPDVMVVAAYGRILPPAWLEAAPLGCINIHASLLPAYRGAAPIQWALLNGEKETGITIMQMDQGLDTGPILLQRRLPIPGDMNFGQLYAALAQLGSQLLLEALPLWASGRLQAQPQPAEGGTYAVRLEREHEAIDWRKTSAEIHNQIRALSPLPGASAGLGGKEIKILAAQVLTLEELAGMTQEYEPGSILGSIRRRGPVVATGDGGLLLTFVQPVGKKPMDGWSWLNGSRLEAGQRFHTEPVYN
ncbi:MAG: methionyl-tRNA formyltransferase [Clostridiales bacterium]